MTDSALPALVLLDEAGRPPRLCVLCEEPLPSRRIFYHPPCAGIVRARTEKRCSTCGVVKPLSCYSKQHTSLDGHRGECKPCASERVMARNDVNPDAPLNAHLVRKYGITLAEFRAMESAQGGGCAICGQSPTGTLGPRSHRQGRRVRPRLVVDHDHETGEIRGLLCASCNKGIGLLGDSSQRVAAALDYLKGAEDRRWPRTL